MTKLDMYVPIYQLPGEKYSFHWNDSNRRTFPVGTRLAVTDTRLIIYDLGEPVPNEDFTARVNFDAEGALMLEVYHANGGNEKPCLDVTTGGKDPMSTGQGHFEAELPGTVVIADVPGAIRVDYGIWDADAFAEGGVRVRLAGIEPNPYSGSVAYIVAVNESKPPEIEPPVLMPVIPGKVVKTGYMSGDFFHCDDGSIWHWVGRA